jgi:two-component system OmpR family sensor kinase
MFRTLYARLALVLVLVLVSIGLIYSLLTLSATRHYLREVNQQVNRNLARNLVADRNLVEQGRLNEAMLKETFRLYMTINPSIEIYLLDRDGTILSYSADPGKVKRKRVSLEPIKAFLRNDAYPVLGDDPRSYERQKAFSVTPIPSAAKPDGYLYVVLQGEEFDAVNNAIRESYFLRLSGWAVAGSLVFGLLAGLLIFHLLTRRLRRLTGLMDQFRTSNLSTHVPYGTRRGADEIDRLGETFDHMAERIISQLDELKTQDALRRELVAQVSHDLRTPLASLHGYLETLQLKAGTLSEQERSEYINIALRHSDRLTRLVMDLFELAKLDATRTPPRCEPFGPAELVQDVVQKFQLQAQRRGVSLVMEIAGDIPLVSAEIGLIERVLENLIENALEHTPAGGRVTVHLRRDGKGVLIEVSDTGCGIAATDLPRVFDRFYQAGNEHRGKGHSGLGLAIAKRILDLHQQSIKVNSAPGNGASFTFSLAAAQASME